MPRLSLVPFGCMSNIGCSPSNTLSYNKDADAIFILSTANGMGLASVRLSRARKFPKVRVGLELG